MLLITKLQNLKAIHNQAGYLKGYDDVVINRKTTKFESNSQRAETWPLTPKSRYQSQNYEIWKQFTTALSSTQLPSLLLSITKLRNLKAIHNLILIHFDLKLVVINHKTTKFESNSQLDTHSFWFEISCYQSQNYKIWKQFTTVWVISSFIKKLLSIAKLQNLKAIHNGLDVGDRPVEVVSDYKDTNFWKQFTTDGISVKIHDTSRTIVIKLMPKLSIPILLMNNFSVEYQSTKLKKNLPEYSGSSLFMTALFMICLV